MTGSRSATSTRATLVDVARAAGVSRQTVSNVLNNPHRVAPATGERVRREIGRLGFKPNPAARALRRRRANALGLQLGSASAGHLGNILDPFLVELTVAARRHDFHVVTFAVDSDEDPTSEYEHILALQMVDGFVLTDTRHDDPRPAWLHARGIPFVSFGRVWDDARFTAWVDVDGFAGVVSGVHHLVQQGYPAVAFLGWPTGSPVGDDRRAGWAAATSELGLPGPALQATAAQDVGAAAVAAGPLLDRLPTGGALICASDVLALGAWTALRDRGLRPGRDVGLVGFDDTDLARAFDITSLRQPLAQIAGTTLDLLAGVGRQSGPPASGVLLQPTVVARASSRRGPPHPP